MIPITKPLIGKEEVEAVATVLLSGWVSQGPAVAQFENEFAEYVGAKYASAVSNCTAALHLALLAVGVRPGDEVITVSHSFIATANAIAYCGAVPVFVDIEAETFNIDPSRIADAVTHRTRAILCVHQVGMPCDLTAILGIARKHSLPLIEDCACAVGSEILWNGTWERIGRPHGDIACFSFHPRKLITTGEGGMITTNNEDWARQFRLLRQHGMSLPDTERHQSKQVMFESYMSVGYNYRMTDIQASIGREQLRRLPEIVNRRRFLANRYKTLLSEIQGVQSPVEPAWCRSNWQSYCVRLPLGSYQPRVMQAMLDAGVATRRGIMCAHREPAYREGSWSCGDSSRNCSCRSESCERLRESERAQDTTVIIPLYHQMTEAEQDKVVAALRAAVQSGSTSKVQVSQID